MKANTLLMSLVAVASVAMGIMVANQEAEKITTRVNQQASPSSEAAIQHLFAQQFPDADGRMQSLAQWQGRPLVLNFWASWCTPCVTEMPELSKLQKDFASRGVQVLGIGIDSAQAIGEFNKKHQISYPLLVAGIDGSELARSLGNQSGGLPYTVVIGADGKVKKTYLGILKFEHFYTELSTFFSKK